MLIVENDRLSAFEEPQGRSREHLGGKVSVGFPLNLDVFFYHFALIMIAYIWQVEPAAPPPK